MTLKPEIIQRGAHLIDLQKFLNIVDIICARPGMCFGGEGFPSLVNFLEGYIVGVSDNRGTTNHPFANLLTLLEHTNGFSHPAWGWPRHFVHFKGSDELAVKDFPSFLRESLAVPEAKVDELFKRRFQLPRKPPESPQTEHFTRK